jgi:hypothetical protein
MFIRTRRGRIFGKGEVMQIRAGSAPFPSVAGHGPQTTTVKMAFSSAVTQATAILTGFIAEFSPSDNDHHFGQLDIQLTVPPATIKGKDIVVHVTFGLTDWDGSKPWSHPYDGRVFFSVIAE